MVALNEKSGDLLVSLEDSCLSPVCPYLHRVETGELQSEQSSTSYKTTTYTEPCQIVACSHVFSCPSSRPAPGLHPISLHLAINSCPCLLASERLP